MKKGYLGLILMVSLIFMISCGNAENHKDRGGAAAVAPPPGSFNLTFSAPTQLAGAGLYCSGVSAGTNLTWPSLGNGPVFVDSGQGTADVALNGVLPGDYICNVYDSGAWQVTLGAATFNLDVTAGVNVYTLTSTDTISNGIGGGNWTFRVNLDGTISCLVNCGINPTPVCTTGITSIDLVVVFKSYQTLTFTPQVRFAGDGFVEHTMTRLSSTMFTYTYYAVPTDQLYTVNFKNPSAPAGQHLFDNNGPTGPYLAMVNGLQVSEMLDDDILVDLDPCGVPIVQYSDLTFNWTPGTGSIHDIQLIFGQGGFDLYQMFLSGSDWTLSLADVPPGRYEANISFLPDQGLPNMAVWPDYIDGTITINGTVMTINYIIDYGQPVSWPDPTNLNMIYLLRANLIFDLLPNGTVVGVDLGDPLIEVIIPIP